MEIQELKTGLMRELNRKLSSQFIRVAERYKLVSQIQESKPVFRPSKARYLHGQHRLVSMGELGVVWADFSEAIYSSHTTIISYYYEGKHDVIYWPSHGTLLTFMGWK